MITDDGGERRITVCLSFEVDAMAVWPTQLGATSQTMMSRGEFDVVAVPRVLSLLERHGLPATFFVPGFTALTYPSLVAGIADAGHEIGHHGWMHEDPATLDADMERRVIERGVDALAGAGVPAPIGYRCPGTDVGRDFVDVLREFGIRYDSSLSNSDVFATYVRRDPAWSGMEPYVFGPVSDLVELPHNWHLDDFPLFEFVPGWSENMYPPSMVREIWQGEFDAAYAQGGDAVLVLSLHPQVIGRGGRLSMLEALVSHMDSLPGVAFETMGAYAERWRAENPVAAWIESHPAESGAMAVQSLPEPRAAS